MHDWNFNNLINQSNVSFSHSFSGECFFLASCLLLPTTNIAVRHPIQYNWFFLDISNVSIYSQFSLVQRYIRRTKIYQRHACKIFGIFFLICFIVVCFCFLIFSFSTNKTHTKQQKSLEQRGSSVSVGEFFSSVIFEPVFKWFKVKYIRFISVKEPKTTDRNIYRRGDERGKGEMKNFARNQYDLYFSWIFRRKTIIYGRISKTKWVNFRVEKNRKKTYKVFSF